MPASVSSRRALATVDIAATGVFALEGALAGILAGLDVFGVFVIGLVTATGGGIIRDVLIGAVPPASLRQQRYVLTTLAAGAVAILLDQGATEIPSWLLTGLDAAGLGLFAAAGAAKALEYELLPMMSVLMGTITAVGGGVIRDILLGEVPAVLRVHVYAVAALVGAAAVVIAARRTAMWRAMTIGVVTTFVLRVAAAAGEWNLPVPGR